MELLLPTERIQAAIVRALRESNSPMSTKELCKATGFSDMAVRGHINKLIASQWIKVSPFRKIGGMNYELNDQVGTGVNVIVNGEVRSFLSLLEEISLNGIPSQGNVFKRNMYGAIFALYEMASNALDDSNPQPISNEELKMILHRVYEVKNQAKLYAQFANDVLAIDSLWDAKSLPKILIMNDREVTLEKIRDLIQEVYDKQS